ncbi:MAG: aminopeptidase [Halobacteriovoraceae bacterium]|nr:aminopeptidase [Halobacteriovoraceae bacterium]
MVSLKKLIFYTLFVLLLSSCAKVSYLWDQGWGQMSLLNSGVKNDSLLKDQNVSSEIKEKVKKIEVFKKHFYDYWDKKPTGIYSKTTILEQDAVTYLVIASKFNMIKPREECFPFMGCFPYLGFFSQEKALNFAKDLSSESWETYVRPVYAYSTLGYFEDTILSSFFHYQEFELAELIFHELFHTLFFIDDEVDLNEALATYFAREMALTYFSYTDVQREGKKAREENFAALNRSFVKTIRELKEIYEKEAPKTPKEAKKLRNEFQKNVMFPKMRKICRDLNLKRCFPVEGEWNNARMAAFLTYQDKGSDLLSLHRSLGLDLKGFYQHIKTAYETYQKEDIEGSFTAFLMKPISSP